MKVLLTNDDGIDAPGLAALEQACGRLAEVLIVAPDRHLSGCSHQATTDRGLRLHQRGPTRWSIDGTPVDCTRVALTHLAQDVDWVVSGINDGGNLGVDVWMSGTVAAVREAVLLGKPGIALSHYRRRGAAIDWTKASRWAETVLVELLAEPPDAGHFWNVNFPHLEGDQLDPPRVRCAVDPSPLAVRYRDERGLLHFDGAYQQRPRREGLDVDRCFEGVTTVSLLSPWNAPPGGAG